MPPTDTSDTTIVSQGIAVRKGVEGLSGRTLGRYVILGMLGSGGMGVVYKAYDPELNRGVALKLIRVKHKRPGPRSNHTTRLLREAQALAQLNHPNVVRVHDVGNVDDRVFVAMELVEGRTLREWRKETRPTTAQALAVMRAAGQGLAAAHKQGLIHRDFKPGNVIVGQDGRVRVIDFGLARTEGQQQPDVAVAERKLDSHGPLKTKAPAEDPARPGEHTDTQVSTQEDKHPPRVGDSSGTPPSSSSTDLLFSPLTRVGTIVGTPMYMAPEQQVGGRIDARADQFSFCVALYEVLYGERPFCGNSLADSDGATAVAYDRVRPRPRGTHVPEWLHHIVVRGLSRDPDRRYPSMDELLEELKEDPEEKRRQHRAGRRRKLLAIGSVVLVVLIPLGLSAGLRIRAVRLCQTVDKVFVGVWDGATKKTVREAFSSTKMSFAQETWQRVERDFDRYTVEWTQMRGEVCAARWLSATQSQEIFDLRMSCLSKRLGELRALVDVFSKANANVVMKAAQASSSLTGIVLCADEEALRAPYPPPNTAEAKAKVEAIRDKLTEVRALQGTGKYREGLELARKIEKEANTVAYLPVQAEVLFQVGALLDSVGQYKQAESTLDRAARTAGEGRDAVAAAKALIRLAWVVGYRQVRCETGSAIGRSAVPVIGLAGDHDTDRATLLSNLGVIADAEGDYEKALKYYREALAIREKAAGPEHRTVAMTLNNIGFVLGKRGENDAALRFYRRALTLFERALGPEHPRVGLTLHNMGSALANKGEYEKALDHYDRALAIKKVSFGSEHPHVAMTLNNMSVLLTGRGEYDQALERAREALEIWTKALGPEHPNLAMALVNMGTVFNEQGDYNKALKYHRLALRLIKRAFGPEHTHVGIPLLGICLVYEVQGERDRTLMCYRRVQALFEKTLGLEDPKLALPLSGIARILFDKGQPEEALEQFERIMSICEKMTCISSTHGVGLFGLARALEATNGDMERATKLAQQARDKYGATPKLFEKEREEVNAWLRKHAVE